MRRSLLLLVALTVIVAVPVRADVSAFVGDPAAGEARDVPVTLRGSLAAMVRQHSEALAQGYAFARTPGDMIEMEARGELVRLEGNEDYGFRRGVRSLVARPETGVFVERLSRAYRAACGEKLVVTSLTRAVNRQPSNAHRLSVHPAGIAVDLRVSRRADCRRWLEGELLSMERHGLVDITREYYPPHYHVALFPESYMAHVRPQIAAERAEREAAARAALLQAEREVARYAAVEGSGDLSSVHRAGAGTTAERLSVLGLLPMALGVMVILRRGRVPVASGDRTDSRSGARPDRRRN